MSSLSRAEDIIQAQIDGVEYTGKPQSRIEKLLVKLCDIIDEGGGDTPTEDDEFSEDDIDDVMSVISTDNDE